MTKQSGAVSVALLLLLCPVSLPAQKKGFRPRRPPSRRASIHAREAARGRRSEAGHASDLRPTESSCQADLNDTGLFQEVKFTSDRGAVVHFDPHQASFSPCTSEMCHLAGPESRPGTRGIPRYRSVLPASGSIVEGYRRTFEELLGAKGAKVPARLYGKFWMNFTDRMLIVVKG